MSSPDSFSSLSSGPMSKDFPNAFKWFKHSSAKSAPNLWARVVNVLLTLRKNRKICANSVKMLSVKIK